MSLLADSPAHSSSSDDFAAILEADLDAISDAELDMISDAELDTVSDASPENEVVDDDDTRVKRRKVESSQVTSYEEESKEILVSSDTKNICPHPGVYAGMCMVCGQKIDGESGVAMGYIHKNLRLASDELTRLRDKDLKNLLRNRKLYLVLDLDHTLLNSARFCDITEEEGYLNGPRDDFPDLLKSGIYSIRWMQMMTKLRPFVQTFLKEASDMFEMYIYTMGERPYALEMANILDPGGVYFHSKVIAKGDCTQTHQKGLDVVMGQESAVLILDDTESVWGKHKENLILMERYHFFASSCKQFGFNCKSLSETNSDESETDGALSTVLKVLKRIHSLFFDQERKDDLVDRDVRQVLKEVRKEVLKDCKLVFSRVFPTNFQAKNHQLWKMAENLGATCLLELDPSVTHVISMDLGTEKSRWAMKNQKFVVSPKWIEASNYLWRKQPEENFLVTPTKNETKERDSS